MVLENLKTLFLRINKIRVLIVFDGTFFFLRLQSCRIILQRHLMVQVTLVRVLDSSEKWNEVDRLTIEDFYMSKLKTIEPQGLNAKHGLFAKLYCKQFP